MGNTDSKSSSILLNHCIALVRPEDASASSPSRTSSPSPSLSVDADPLSLNLSIFKLDSGPDVEALFSDKPNVPLDTVFNDFYLDFISVDVQDFSINSSFKKILQIISSLNPPNFNNLIVFLSLYIILSANSLPASRTGLHSSRLINAIKTLSILIPIYFDRVKSSTQDHYDVFWATQHEIEGLPLQNIPLGERLLLAILKLAFQDNFTTAVTAHPSELWEIGILTNSNKYRSLLNMHHQWHLFANRLLLLRLLAALFSSDLYTSGGKQDINMFLVYWCTQMPKDKSIQFTSSLLNCTMRFILNNNKDFQSLKANFFSSDATASNWQTLYFQFVQSCLHVLNLSMSYKAQDNVITIFLTQLQREYDLKLILSSFIKIFKYPIDLAIEQESNIFNFTNNKHIDASRRRAVSTSSHDNSSSSHASLPSSSSAAYHTKPQTKPQLPEIHPLLIPMTILMTNLIDCNKCFQNYFADKFASRFIIFSIYYLKYYDYSSLSSSSSTTRSNSSTTSNGTSNDTSNERSIVELNENSVSQILLPLLNHLLLILTSKKLVLFKMLQTFNLNYYTNNLPNFYKLSNINGDINNLTFRDFTIIQLSNLILDNIKFNLQPNPIFYELIYNLLPINDEILTSSHKNDDSHDDLILLSAKKKSASPSAATSSHTSSSKLSYNAAMSLLYVLSKSSNKVYLTTYATPVFKSKDIPYMISPGFKMDLLALLLRSITIFFTLYFDDAENLLFAMVRHQSITHQINDSINSISKALDMNPNLNSHIMTLKQMGFNRKVQWKDFYQFEEITDLPQVNLYSSANQQHQNQQQGQNDNRGQNQNEDPGQENESPTPYLLFNPASLENETSGTVKHFSSTNHDKNYQVIAFIDFKSDSNLNLQHQLEYWPHRPQWPTPLTFTHKCKNPKYENFNEVWSGTVYLQILLRVIKQILSKVPEIPRIKSVQYFETLSKLSALRSDILTTIHPRLPLDVRRLTTFQPLSMHTNDKLLMWFHIATWANIFTQTSFKYEETFSHELRQFESLLDISIDECEGNTISKPTTDRLGYIRRSRGQSSVSLERTISAGSGVSTPTMALNRTKSNGSGNLMNYFFQNTAQNHFQHLRSSSSSSSITLEKTTSNSSSIRTRPNSHHVAPETNNNNSTNGNSNNSSNGGFSFFKWKWGGNNSNGGSDDTKASQRDPNVSTSIITDNLNSYMFEEEISPGVVNNIIENNIWVGTDIRLFKIANFRKESFSFLEMTSSFFKKFKFINSDNDNYNNNEFDDNTQLRYTSRGLYR
ncbi:ADI_G0044490.mRNA.1.CDS.1 [Saccharomyces cerevisiae]|nr:Ecm30p [Saccharomyces cerevisiae YJM993]AJV83081.1 Ecm30p [Saccharomyces cerevisiae YJM969]AJV83537.1 Ecm30p [Saccharomyces cerevisiae YJM972]AJV83985.1 Ecm30p [Saccharomyces cerevisiae YJM975]AJV84440.1 Ecm30p [Saccharomyces cerevisiae YJM978]AJV84893.1 Ecm30p [Saccharomyces cerevisiae YJM981]AJV85346.1 Ecm30p [Saccharomyces cerevisiae YJM984]AJV85800.1 Ecm30p [Saccharomyces cerevisiae YJM987]AJV86254.1 Ecm30p [Saccharomyces cerevisiae YJM990]AJV86709.1 Ecm30p [Saccharomyces cerevisiae